MDGYRKAVKNVFLIGVYGRSRCGKDSVIQHISAVNRNVIHVNMDIFFKDKTLCKYGGYECWEHKDIIRFDHLFKVVSSLKEGLPVIVEDRSLWYGSYDCKLLSQDLYDGRIVIVQGFLLFAEKKLANLFDHKIFIDVSDKNMLKRRPGEYTRKVVIPVSKEYAFQSIEADKSFDSNCSKAEDIADELVNYVNGQISFHNCANMLVASNQLYNWEVSPGDLLSDHEWHPINQDNLKNWVKQGRDKMQRGVVLKGNTFEYRLNHASNNFEVRLRCEPGYYRHIYRYTIEPTKSREII